MKSFGKLVYILAVTIIVAGSLGAGIHFGLQAAGEEQSGGSQPPENLTQAELSGTVQDSAPAGASGKRVGKVISLAEAVTIAEKAARGQATKAERKDLPSVTFQVAVSTWNGASYTVELNGEGQVIDKKAPLPKGRTPPQGKKKGEGKGGN